MAAGGAVAEVPCSMSSDQRSRVSRSSGSTPSMSPIMIIGRCAATSPTKSNERFARARSIRSTQIARTFASCSAMRRGVNPLFTRLRRRLCAGSSMLIMDGIGGESGRMPSALQKVSGFLATRITSS
jgi:hypothetical protein